jgi:hypothetical protein
MVTTNAAINIIATSSETELDYAAILTRLQRASTSRPLTIRVTSHRRNLLIARRDASGELSAWVEPLLLTRPGH